MYTNSRRLGRALLVTVFMAGCSPGSQEAALSSAEREQIRADIERTLREAYDLSKPDVLNRMLSLYPASGSVVSANGGRIVQSRDTLAASIRYFWENVGVNMRDPKWVWDAFHVDVLSRTAAAVTATYHIPHRNPRNQPHVLGGAMTAVFEKRDGRWVIVQEHLSDLPQLQDTSARSP